MRRWLAKKRANELVTDTEGLKKLEFQRNKRPQQRDGPLRETLERNLARLNDRDPNVLSSPAYCPERPGLNYNVAILKFRKAVHPFGLSEA